MFESLFNKVYGNFIEKRLQRRCFPVNIPAHQKLSNKYQNGLPFFYLEILYRVSQNTSVQKVVHIFCNC